MYRPCSRVRSSAAWTLASMVSNLASTASNLASMASNRPSNLASMASNLASTFANRWSIWVRSRLIAWSRSALVTRPSAISAARVRDIASASGASTPASFSRSAYRSVSITVCFIEVIQLRGNYHHAQAITKCM